MKRIFNRKVISSIAGLLLILPLLILSACEGGEQNATAELSLREDPRAAALTIGWYLPLDYLQKIVGPDFTPTVAKDDTLGVMKLVISRSDQLYIENENKGAFHSAMLLIEVNEPNGVFRSSPPDADHAYICPVIIVSGNFPMAQKYHEKGFVTEGSTVQLKVNESGERISVEATISSQENRFTARCFFEDLPVDEDDDILVINQTRPMYRYFYGSERYNRYLNGKGRLDAEGTTLLTTLGIQQVPYFFMLDTGLSWGYDFN